MLVLTCLDQEIFMNKSLYDRCGNIKQRLVVSLHFYSNNYKSYQKALKKPYLPTLIYEPSPSTRIQENELVFFFLLFLPKNME